MDKLKAFNTLIENKTDISIKYDSNFNDAYFEALNSLQEDLKVKQAHWRTDRSKYCSLCLTEAPYDVTGNIYLSEFCPNCGAKMTNDEL